MDNPRKIKWRKSIGTSLPTTIVYYGNVAYQTEEGGDEGYKTYFCTQ
jgi:hypothetical protein